MDGEGASKGRPMAIDMALDDAIKLRSDKTRKSRGHGVRKRNHSRRPHYSPRSRFENISVNVINDRALSPRQFPLRQRRRPVTSRTTGNIDMGTSTIVISNLFHEVSEEDLRRLFSQVGPVRDVRLQYDRAGRSSGVAQVSFINKRDVLLAIDRFHNIPLDGHPMQISRAERPTSRYRDANTDEAINLRHQGNLPSRPNRHPADLDADLDTYMMRTEKQQ